MAWKNRMAFVSVYPALTISSGLDNRLEKGYRITKKPI